ncbi:MAG: DNA-3-methyladenine glycosylase 2 family protein [Ruminococcaceae bacterium]|nr:DNA-3-methyladenine glycosylase 2 family protein [Oscillospiraceae bacterium]
MPYIIDSDKLGITVGGIGNFSPEKTFDCGQCFRFEPLEGGGVTGIAHGRRVSISRMGECLRINGISADEFENTWEHYLALDEDYDSIDRMIAEAVPFDKGGQTLADAAAVSAGIRILRQEKWETLCSFIISQNNNIPRIKKIISAMSEKWGERIGDEDFAFPTAKALADAGEDAIFSLRTGFRAKYIIDAAQKVADDPGFLDTVAGCSDYAEADMLLRAIKGVGPKVSACTLLFGFGRTDAFPIDVWIKRVLEKYFPEGFDPAVFGNAAGIAQQYLFYYERYNQN